MGRIDVLPPLPFDANVPIIKGRHRGAILRPPAAFSVFYFILTIPFSHPNCVCYPWFERFYPTDLCGGCQSPHFASILIDRQPDSCCQEGSIAYHQSNDIWRQGNGPTTEAALIWRCRIGVLWDGPLLDSTKAENGK